MTNAIQSLRDYLDASPSVYHAVANVEAMLTRAGYTHLEESSRWELTPGGKYYLTRNGSALLAFRIPRETPRGFLMSASHSDRPGFKVKENAEIGGAYNRLEVERYGGMLMSTWMDRPLTLAGRALVQTPEGAVQKLIYLDRDLLLIPNVAIHMNRAVNEGQKWNPAVDMLPLAGSKDTVGGLRRLLEQEAGGRILGYDLYLTVRGKSSVWGLEEEYLSAAALDDLECVWGCTRGFLNSADHDQIPVLCLFDSEEVGSRSVAGAGSMILPDTLRRICDARGLDIYTMLSQSFMVSADNGHALHPNHPELGDHNNAPILGGGLVLKFNSSQRYTTDGLSAAIFRSICQRGGVPVQTFYNRADIDGGATLGHVSLLHVSVPSADIGVPQLAMHSSYETAAVADALSLEKAMTAYFSTKLTLTSSGFTLK